MKYFIAALAIWVMGLLVGLSLTSPPEITSTLSVGCAMTDGNTQSFGNSTGFMVQGDWIIIYDKNGTPYPMKRDEAVSCMVDVRE